ncbi:MAG: hypothetical protein P0Y62_00360 [Candidatus Chryseobacterium colombiense]|nr:hypothetical protein [Chryseobacterium sp.]WEK70005.1 MAG: hypothetical protein P0Y62_00360 [Chryseobacterium sp.]
MKTKILIGITSILFFLIGFNNYQSFLNFFLGLIPELEIQYRTLYAQLSQTFFFGLVLSVIPILSLILWIKFKIQHNGLKIFIILLFLVSSIIASISRTLFLKWIYQGAYNAMSHPKPLLYEGEDLNYNLYIFVSEIIIFILLYFILKKPKIREQKIND